MARWNLLQQLVEMFIGDECVGVEIGVHHAETSIYLLENAPKLNRLYCIDPYENRDERYDIVQNALDKYDNCTLLRMRSHEASSIVPDNVDFVFIDGDHSFEGVLMDLQDWVPKIKSQGLLIGHDWTSRTQGVPDAGMKYIGENEDIFEPLFGDERLKEMGLCFKISGQGLIHKQRYNAWAMWWRIKK